MLFKWFHGNAENKKKHHIMINISDDYMVVFSLLLDVIFCLVIASSRSKLPRNGNTRIPLRMVSRKYIASCLNDIIDCS